MYKIKRFSILRNTSMGALAGATGGLALGGRLGLSNKATGALMLSGSILGAGIGAYASRNKTYTPKPTNSSARVSDEEKEVLNSIVLPNLPKEYDNLKKFAEGARKIEKMYYESQDDWELYTDLHTPENIASSYIWEKKYIGSDYLRILEFGMQDYLIFYYNIKDKSWYYDSKEYQLNKNYPKYVKVTSFKNPIIKLYEITLKEFEDEGEEFEDYIRYLKAMIKYVKSSNLK